MQTVLFIQRDLSEYMDVINGGEHHVFSEASLPSKIQLPNSHGQLCWINEYLKEIIDKISEVESTMKVSSSVFYERSSAHEAVGCQN